MTATRPVTTPNLHCAPPCAKPADHHDTPRRDGRSFKAAQRRTAPRPQTPHRGQGSIATTRATCDVRAESRRVHLAWRVCDSPALQEHGGELGSFLLSSVECTHHPLLRGYHHGHVFRVASLLCTFVSCHAVCSCGGRRLALCAWSRGQGAWRQTRRLSGDRGGMHHSRPLYDRPAELRSQIEAGRPTCQPSPPPATPHSGALAPHRHSVRNDR